MEYGIYAAAVPKFHEHARVGLLLHQQQLLLLALPWRRRCC